MKTSIKASLVSAAVASALGSVAHALPAANWNDGVITVFYAGGGSAEVQAVYVAATKLMNSASVNVFTDNSGTVKHPQSANYLMVSGTLNAAVGTLASGAEVGFMYKYNGGSFPNGGLPHATATPTALLYPTLASLATSCVTKASAPNSGPFPSSFNPDFNCTATVVSNSQVPDWGITDEEEKLFNFPFNLNGANGSKSFATIGGHAQPLYVAPFGVAVTAALYNHKKLWSKAEVAAVLSGSVLTWSQLTDDAGVALPASLGAVTLIDRGSGSGTKAAGSSYFLDYPGGSFSLAGAITPNSVAVALPGNTFPNGGYTGALNTAFSTSSTEIQDIKEASSAAEADDLLTANQAGIGALAILGLEYPPIFEQTNAGTNDYFFAAINGTYPDSQTGDDNVNTAVLSGSTRYSNIIKGSYDFAYQTGFNYHAASLSAMPAFQFALYNNLASENISSAHTGLAFPSSAPGVLLDPRTTGHSDAGNLSWSRSGVSAGAPQYVGPVAQAAADPLF
jgi:hypothetical protein